MTKPATPFSLVAGALLALSFALAGCDKSSETPAEEKTRQAQRLIDASAENFPLPGADTIRAFQDGARSDSLKTDAQIRAYADSVSRRNLENIMQGYDPAIAQEQLEKSQADLLSGAISVEEFGNVLLKACMQIEQASNSFAALGRENRQKKLDAARQAANSALAMATTDQRPAANMALATVSLAYARGVKRDLLLEQLEVQQAIIDLASLSSRVDFLNNNKTIAENSRINDVIPAQRELLTAVIERNNRAMLELKTFEMEYSLATARLEEIIAKASEMDKEYIKMLQEAETMSYPERFEVETQAYALRSDADGIIELEKQIEVASSDLAITEIKIALRKNSIANNNQLIAKTENAIERLATSPATTTDIDKQIKLLEDSRTDLMENILTRFGQLSSLNELCKMQIAKIQEYYNEALKYYQSAGQPANANEMQNRIKNEISSMFMTQAEFYGALAYSLNGVSAQTVAGIEDLAASFEAFSIELAEKATAIIIEPEVQNTNYDMMMP